MTALDARIGFGLTEKPVLPREFVAVRTGVPVSCPECNTLMAIPQDVMKKRGEAFYARKEQDRRKLLQELAGQHDGFYIDSDGRIYCSKEHQQEYAQCALQE